MASRTESEWDDQQRGYMLALDLYRRMTCTGCGGWMPETTTHEAEDYAVSLPVRCGRCTALAIAQDRHAESSQHMHATRWDATLRRR